MVSNGNFSYLRDTLKERVGNPLVLIVENDMATNFDLFETDSKDIFVYLSGRFYLLSGDMGGKSFARQTISKRKYGNAYKIGDIRKYFTEVKNLNLKQEQEAYEDF